jgi:uncharacterized protein YjbI with pentapeptide repeats
MKLELTGNLRKRDFSGHDLAGVVFRDADLFQARFDGARLVRAVFAGCFAAEATFDRADCTKLRATGANFYRSSFRDADLTDSLFWDCVLAGADLREAKLHRITLTLDCNSFEELRLGRTASAKLAYLFGRARTPHRQGWIDIIGDHDLVLLERLFKR